MVGEVFDLGLIYTENFQMSCLSPSYYLFTKMHRVIQANSLYVGNRVWYDCVKCMWSFSEKLIASHSQQRECDK